MWLEEKVAHNSKINPKSGICCQSGKVLLALLPPSSEYLDELLKDHFFMKNIRSLNSMFCFTSMGGILASIVEGLIAMLDSVNLYVQIFRSARDALQHDNGVSLHICFLHSRSNRQYNQPTTIEIAALIIVDNTDAAGCQDIIVSIEQQRLNYIKTHQAEMRGDSYQGLEDAVDSGDTDANISVIEFQKRGLTHSHMTRTLAERDKPITSDDIDQFICAEIPDKDTNPKAYEMVVRCMVHGPCGVHNPSALCMVEGKVVYQTFKQTWLNDDNEWHGALSEAETWASSIKLRNIVREELRDNNVQLSDEDLKEWGLQEIEHILSRNGKSIGDFPPIPQPSFRMMHQYSFEALSKTLNDLLKETEIFSADKPFGGKLCILGGDLSKYNQWLLKVGMRLLWQHHCTNLSFEIKVELPEEFLIENGDNSLLQLINKTYPELSNRYRDPTYLKQRAILVPKNSDVDDINYTILSMLPGEVRQFCSVDTLRPGEMSDHEQKMNPPKSLNIIKISGIPNHCLELKEGSTIMLLRNFNQSFGLCNGT
ncbi:hypothetical protein BUALT_Bualt08G0062300 [Buddleja alternifolia]|uniref:ATP-dependent DNA helicase n=1 Tax=Buddleja alternifolia TaxID=168488 RepID=A0AAV6XBF3_9LAMI|nr:hypothetical protein BUALT_Bualt08G0062300 [Buddleja alternifolia]